MPATMYTMTAHKHFELYKNKELKVSTNFKTGKKSNNFNIVNFLVKTCGLLDGQ